MPNLSPDESILVRAGRKLVGDLTANHQVGAVTGTPRLLLETDAGKIIYVNAQTGDDGTGDGTSGNPYETYAKAKTDISASKTTIEWQTNDNLPEITDPTQVSEGVVAEMGHDVTQNWSSSTKTPTGVNDAIVGMKSDTAFKGRYVSGGSDLRYSDDGESFTVSTLSGGSIVNVIAIKENSSGIIMGIEGNQYWRSVDGGVNFTRFAIPSGSIEFLDIVSDESGAFFALSNASGGRIYKTTDQISWSILGTPGNNGSLHWSVENQLFLAGAANGAIEYSSDGSSWSTATVVDIGTVKCIRTASNGDMIASGPGGLQKSTDGGVNWSSVGPGANHNNINQIEVNPLKSEILIGQSDNTGVMYRTTDLTTFTSFTGDSAFSTKPTRGLAVNAFGKWVVVGSSTDVQFTTFTVDDSASGVNFTERVNLAVASKKYFNCDFVKVDSSESIEIERSFLTGTLDKTVEITANTISIKDSLIVQGTSGNEAIRITGAAVSLADILINQNTIIGNVFIDNDTGGAGFEQIRDNIIEGNIEETESTSKATIESSNIRGTTTNFLLTKNVISLDPSFVDAANADYRLQRKVGYTDTERFIFDSPLFQSSVFTTLIDGNQREMGAYSFDSSSLQFEFTLAKAFPKPAPKDTIIVTKNNNINIQPGLDGELDLLNQPVLATEQVEITYQGIRDECWDFLNLLDNLSDTRVNLSFSSNQLITLPTIQIDGAFAVGNSEISIDSSEILNGSTFLHGGKRYYIMFTFPQGEPASTITIDRPLETALADNTVLTLETPFSDGEYIYIPSSRSSGRYSNIDTEYRTNVKIRFIRKAIL